MFRSRLTLIAVAAMSMGACVLGPAAAMPVIDATDPASVLAPKLDREREASQERTKSFLNSLPTLQEIKQPAISPPAARISAVHDGSDARRLIEGPNGLAAIVPRPG